MQLNFTEEALKDLERILDKKEGYLKLKHDTDGCGCVVSGVSALWLVSELQEKDFKLQTNGPEVYMEYNTDVFFAEEMTIDVGNGNQFRLKSPNEMLNPNLKFLDLTK